MADDLLPCPFCGNDGSGPVEDALHITYFEADWRSESWSVQCDKCTATMGYFDSEDEAIAAWNRRATPTVQEAAKVLLACHTVQTMIAAGRPLDLAVTLRAIAGESHE